jgi:hypothetical protein
MHIFHLHAEKELNGTLDTCTWPVIADSLLEAASLMPEGFYMKTAEVQKATIAGPRRVIACFAPTTIH